METSISARAAVLLVGVRVRATGVLEWTGQRATSKMRWSGWRIKLRFSREETPVFLPAKVFETHGLGSLLESVFSNNTSKVLAVLIDAFDDWRDARWAIRKIPFIGKKLPSTI